MLFKTINNIFLIATFLLLTACGGGVEDHFSQDVTKSPTINISYDKQNRWTIAWPAQTSAQGYTVYIADNIALENPTTLNVDNTDELDQELTEMLAFIPAGESRFIAVAAKWEGKIGEKSNILEVKIQPIAPANISKQEIDGVLQISWETPEEADENVTYNVYWSTDPNVSPASFQGSQIEIDGNQFNYIPTAEESGKTLYYAITIIENDVESVVSQRISLQISMQDFNEALPVGNEPKVLVIFPGNGAIDVGKNTANISLTFDKKMAPASINTNSFKVLAPDSSAVSGIVQYDRDGKTASFTPAASWLANAKYTVVLTNAILDENGNNLEAEFRSSFTTKLPNLNIGDVSVNEGAGFVVLSVTLDEMSVSPVTINYITVSGSAVADADFTQTNSTLTLQPEATSGTIEIDIENDFVFEGEEQFSVNLSNVVGAVISKVSSLITIQDDEGIPAISVGDISVSEAEGTASIKMTLAPASTESVTVNYETGIDTAMLADYSDTRGSITFAPGEIEKTVPITIANDNLYESDEQFLFLLSNVMGSNATIADASASIVITNDDVMPELNFSDVSVSESAGAAVINFMLSEASGAETTVSYSTTSTGTAKPLNDFIAVDNGMVTFAPGETTKTISITLVDDAIAEDDEQFQVNLSAVKGASNESSQVTVTIQDDEGSPGVRMTDVSVDEASGTATVKITLIPANSESVTVDFTTSNGTATLSDYGMNSGSIIFQPGETEKTVSITITDDSLYENSEQLTLSLSNMQGNGVTIADAIALITITNDDAMPNLSFSDVSVVESTETAIINFILSEASGLPITINYSTTSTGTAMPGSDFIAVTNGVLTFVPGETNKDISIMLVDDAIAEGDEKFQVNLNAVTGASNESSQILVTIQDDEGNPAIRVNDVTVSESSGTAAVKITLIPANNESVTIGFTTNSGTATLADYGMNSGNIIFQPGETEKTVSIMITNDSLYENDEQLTLSLSNVQGNGVTLADATALITITNDDAMPRLNFNDVSVSESAGIAVINFTLSAASGLATTINYSTTSTGTATPTNDFIAVTNGVLTFVPGETNKTISITLIDDDIFESDEQFEINLYVVTGVSNEFGPVSVTIQNDEENPVISVGDITITEAAGTASVVITLLPVSSESVTIDFTTSNGTATLADYEMDSGSVIFEPGQAENTVSITIVNDSLYENDEQLTFSLSNVQANGVTIADAVASITITDDDTMPSLSFSDVSVSESAGMADINFVLSEASGAKATINYNTVSTGTATPINDYIAVTNGVLTFAPGETNKTISIALVDDSVLEGDEQFEISLNAVDGATSEFNQIIVTIEGDNAPVLTVTNGDGKVTLTWPAFDGATSYNVYYAEETSVTPSNYSAVGGALLGGQTSGVVLNNLRLWLDHYFVLTALSDGIESASSAEQIVQTMIIPIKPLNDTGITRCADYAFTDIGAYAVTGSGAHNGNLECAVQPGVPTQISDGSDNDGDIIRGGQDALYGRDVTNNDDSDGDAGFSFTKLDDSGNALADQAQTYADNPWSCIKDNITGLIWEVKTASGLRSSGNTYSWYNSTGVNDGGNAGMAAGGSCFSAGRCDTEKYVADVNAQNSDTGLCGATDWRLPNKHELISIVNNKRFNPTVDSAYFPNTQASRYWSLSPNAANNNYVWYVAFYNHYVSIEDKSSANNIRLVRDSN